MNNMETPEQITLKIDELDKDLLRRKATLNMIEIERHTLKKRLVELNEGVRLEKHNISTRILERKILERQFWSSKGR